MTGKRTAVSKLKKIMDRAYQVNGFLVPITSVVTVAAQFRRHGQHADHHASCKCLGSCLFCVAKALSERKKD